MNKYNTDLLLNRTYKKIRDHWQIPLERKRIQRAKRMERDALKKPKEEAEEKIVVHNPVDNVVFPPAEDRVFAVVEINGFQHKIKVAKDDVVMCEKLPHEIGTKLTFENVLLLGTPHYTAIGRPTVKTAVVFATVEQQTKTEKVIIFKKKRRKNYQRNKGHRQEITMLRIEKIEHNLNPQDFEQKYEVLQVPDGTFDGHLQISTS